MKITQGVLKYCKIYNVTFEDKYSNIKTIKSIENFDSKFSSNSGTSQTSTVLSNNNSYYNVVEESNINNGRILYNCDVENGRFLNSTFLSLNNANHITDGYFSGCTFSGYTINGGQFFDCTIHSGCTWNNGQWNDGTFNVSWTGGVWNKGIFPFLIWPAGIFNGGIFKFPSVWITGVANGGIFSGITWNHGLVRNGDFLDCTFMSGSFNNGNFSDGTFIGGIFNNGKMDNSVISGGIFNDGTISNCTVSGNTEINGGDFSDTIINDGKIVNMNGTNLIVNYGKFYNGTYDTIQFITGDIYNGLYLNSSGITSGLTIHNGTFKKSAFWLTNIHNGNFTNCYSENVKWDYGIYTEGSMMFNLPGSYWNDGYWNDGIFTAIDPIVSILSNVQSIDAITTTTTAAPTTTTTTTIAPHYIGEKVSTNGVIYGTIFYLYSGGKSGLISANVDTATITDPDSFWASGSGGYQSTGGRGTSIGTGQANSTAMLAQPKTNGHVIKYCHDLSLGGFTDWFLGSKYEVLAQYSNRSLIGGFSNNGYWSSTESNYDHSIAINFGNGVADTWLKHDHFYVRAIRFFDDTIGTYTNVIIDNTSNDIIINDVQIGNSSIFGVIFPISTGSHYVGTTTLNSELTTLMINFSNITDNNQSISVNINSVNYCYNMPHSPIISIPINFIKGQNINISAINANCVF
jgi:hypothetical protein